MKFNNNYTLGKKVILGKNVKIGDRTVIYDNVVIGDNTIISNDCIIGEPTQEYYFSDSYKNPRTVIGAHSLIRSHTIIYANSKFGDYLQTGHRVMIREKTKMGSHCSVGTLSDIQGYATFGDYCRLHSNAHVCQGTKIGNFVFIYPYVVFTNDPTPPSNVFKGVTVGDFSIISTGALIMPGIKIGMNCLVAAGSVVTKNVRDFELIVGVPGKKVCDVRDVDSREHTSKKHYPWVHNFSRGMPWEKIGYKKWMVQAKRKLR